MQEKMTKSSRYATVKKTDLIPYSHMNESQYIEPGFVPLPQIQEIQKDIKKPKEYPKINKKLQEISEKLMNANP